MADISIAPGDLLYDFKVSGEIEVTRGFEEHLEISGVKVTVSYADNVLIRNLLKKGSYHTVLGYRCRVHDWQITDYTDQQVLTYELTLKHENAPMDTEIPAIRHALDTPVKVKANCDSSDRLVLSNIVTYTGLQGYRIPFDKPDGELEVTPRSLLNEYKRRLHSSDAAFIDWDNLTFKEWGKTPAHTIQAISEEIKISEPGQGADIGGIQLTNEAYGLEWVSEKEEEEKFDIYEIDVVEPVRKFYGGAETVSRGEYDLESFKSSGCWFDSGGLTKERITTWLCNSKPYKKQVEKWGFIGSSIGAVSKPNHPRFAMYDYLRTHDYERKVAIDEEGNEVIEYVIKARNIDHSTAFDCWQKFYDVIEQIDWNPITQYRGDSRKTGWILYRPKSESQLDALNTLIEDDKMDDELAKLNEELLKLLAEEEPDVKAVAEKKKEIAEKDAEVKKNKEKNAARRRLYAGFRVVSLDPLRNYTRHKLGSLANRYSDIHATDEFPYLFCEELEEAVDWFETFPDPDADDSVPPEEQPKISVGERYHKKVQTDILLPRARVQVNGVEEYRVIEAQLNNQGYNFRDRIELSPETYTKGRPSEHERREFYGRVGGGGGGVGGVSLNIPKQSDPINVTNILSTPGSGFNINTESPKGTWSSPGVTNLTQAKKAFELEYSIENTQNARVASFETDANPSILPGDIVNWNNLRWVLLNSKITWTIEAGNAHADKMEVDLGYLVLFGDLWQHYNPTADPADAPSAIVETKSYLVDAESVLQGEPVGGNVGAQFKSAIDNLVSGNVQFDEMVYGAIVSIDDGLSGANGLFNNTEAYITDPLRGSNASVAVIELGSVDSYEEDIPASSNISYKSISFADNKRIDPILYDRLLTSIASFALKLGGRISTAESVVNTVQVAKFRILELSRTGYITDGLESSESDYRTLDYSEVGTIDDNPLSSTSNYKLVVLDEVEVINDNPLSSTSNYKLVVLDEVEVINDNLISSSGIYITP